MLGIVSVGEGWGLTPALGSDPAGGDLGSDPSLGSGATRRGSPTRRMRLLGVEIGVIDANAQLPRVARAGSKGLVDIQRQINHVRATELRGGDR